MTFLLVFVFFHVFCVDFSAKLSDMYEKNDRFRLYLRSKSERITIFKHSFNIKGTKVNRSVDPYKTDLFFLLFCIFGLYESFIIKTDLFFIGKHKNHNEKKT